jgi:hypothetical protein
MEGLQLSDIERQMAEDLHWGLGAPEIRQHAGKLVAVHRKRLVGVGTDRQKLVAEAAERAQCPWEDVVVLVVPPADLSELPR